MANNFNKQKNSIKSYETSIQQNAQVLYPDGEGRKLRKSAEKAYRNISEDDIADIFMDSMRDAIEGIANKSDSVELDKYLMRTLELKRLNVKNPKQYLQSILFSSN